MPEPIPVAWQSPIMPRSPSALSRHMGGALLGLVLGLAIAVPGVLWYKGRFDPMALAGLTAADLGLAVAAPSNVAAVKEREPVAEVRRTVVAPVAPVDVVGSIVPSASSQPRAAPTPIAVPREEPAKVPVAELKPVPVEIINPVVPPPPAIKPEVAMLDDARRLIGDGDFAAARRLLENQLLATTPAARFLSPRRLIQTSLLRGESAACVPRCRARSSFTGKRSAAASTPPASV